MIYLKRPDGTIEQFDDDLMGALHIDKEIQGESFGEIFTSESLPDEDKISLGIIDINSPEYFNKCRDEKLNEISQAFDNEFIKGYFFSEALGIDVDYRRNGTKNDLQNVEKLIKFMERKSLTEMVYYGYEKQETLATLTNIKTLVEEMEDHGVFLHGKKKGLEQAVDDALRIEDLDNINW